MLLLDKKNLLEDTIVIITADHGGQFPNIPIRDNKGHRVNSFADELYKIPLIFYNTDIRAQVYDGLVSSVDINATILDMVGIDVPNSFRGKSILDNNYNRKYVISENQGRGPCHFTYKPIFVCVRSEYYKIVYKTIPPKHDRGNVVEFYDITNDPDEYNNLFKNKDLLYSVSNLVKIAKNRVREIVN